MGRFAPAVAAIVVLVGLFALTLAFWWILLPVLALVVLSGVAALAVHAWRDYRAVRRFRAVWGARGRDLLLVYSNSPNWQPYVEANWLPRWGERAVVLNWSERSRWSD